MARSRSATRRASTRRRRGLAVLGVIALVAGMAITATSIPASVALAAPVLNDCNSTVALTNGSFELPVVPYDSSTMLQDAQVNGWSTTASDRLIEIWRTPFLGVTAAAGNQFAELNATQTSTLYQDVATTPGQALRWELMHRGRAGTDTMQVLMGTPGATLTVAATLSDGLSWGIHSGIYIVPAGQTTTRFAFKALSTASGDNSVGNFLDAVSFGTGACIVATKTVANTSGSPTARVGDTLTYTIAATNGGGNPAQLSSIVDNLPAGLTFVPGSIRTTTGTTTTSLSDASGDDAGEYASATRRVTARIGAGATSTSGGSIAAQETRSLSFQARIDTAAALQTLNNTATVNYTDSLSGTAGSVDSNTQSTSVVAASDLAVSQSLDSALLAGTTAQYTIVVTNNGPQSNTGVVVTISLPPLTGVTTSGASCSQAAATLTCAIGALSVGAVSTIVVMGTIPSNTTPGTNYRVTSQVAGDVYDQLSANNVATTSGSTTESADLSLVLQRSPATPTAGTDVTYTIDVTNIGPSDARSLTITDPLTTGDQFVSATIPGGTCAQQGGSIVCTLASLAAGAVATATIVVTLDPTGLDAVTNTARVAAATPDPVSSNNVDSVDYNPTGDADLTVDIWLDKTEAYAGEVVGYHLVLTNNGPSAASNVSLSTALPAGFAILSRNGGGYCTQSACTYDEILPGESFTVFGDGFVGPTAEAGPGHATTTVISPTPDSHPENNSDTVDFTILLEADLEISQSFAADIVPGALNTEVITVVNHGRTRAESLVVATLLPESISTPVFDAGAGSCELIGLLLNCTLNDLAVAATWTISVTATPDAAIQFDSFTVTNSVSSSTFDPDLSNNTDSVTIPVQVRADLELAKTTITPTVVQTDAVSFDVTVTNHGPSVAWKIFVAELPRPGVVITSATPDAGTYDNSTGSWALASLGVGETATLSVTGTAQGNGTIVNDVAISDTLSLDPNSANDEASAQVSVTPANESLSIQSIATVTPSSRQSAAIVGDTVAYSYLVTNTGNVRMSSIAVDDSLVGAASCPLAALDPGESQTCTATSTHRISQANFDSSSALVSTSVASGVPPLSAAAVESAIVVASVTLAAENPILSVTKIANFTDSDTDSTLDVGETIEWSVLLENLGDVSLVDVLVDDPTAGPMTCAVTSLAPGDSTTCTAVTYVVTLADVIAGVKPNTATADAANSRGGPRISGNSSTTLTPSVPAPSISVTTTGVVDPSSRQTAAALGDLVNWFYVVTNTGNVTVTDVAIDDPEGGTITCDVTMLLPGETASCAAGSYREVVEADLVVGWAVNGATATATSPSTASVVVAAESIAVITTESVRASLTIATTVDNVTMPGARPLAGDRLRAIYVVVNTSNVTLATLTVSDPIFGAVTCTPTTLSPGGASSCTADAEYTVSALDSERGIISRTVIAAGEPPIGSGALAAHDEQLSTLAVTGVDPPLSPPTGTTATGLAIAGVTPAPAAVVGALLVLLGMLALAAARRRPRVRYRARHRMA